MPTPLLSTKFYVPPIRPDLVPRPDLIELLERGLERKLTLLSAPAGFGKTTLLSQWISQSKTPFAWLSLDKDDNDRVRFLAYCIAALRRINVNVDDQLLATLQSPQQPHIETVLIPLINQIAATKDRFALVLDDYHLIESREIHDALAFILDHQPPSLHLVIASRSDPPLPVAKMRARREINEVRAAHLRFSLEEGDRFLNQVQGLNLSRADLQSLIGRTEGWIAGLQMASLTLKRKVDASVYIQDFAGSHDYIADYLTDEVINQLPEHIHDFLLRTSILDRLSGSLCDAVTGQQDSQHILKQLKGANLFVVSLDDESQWYRYHRLFSDLLHQRLLQSKPQVVPDLYLKASEWFETNGFMDHAIDYSLRGRHFQRAVVLIEQVAEQIIERSEIAMLLRWLDGLPEELVRDRVTLSIFYAWALLVRGERSHLAADYLNAVVPTNEHILNQMRTVKAMLAMYQRHVPEAIALARQALEGLPEDDLFFRNLAAWNLSAALYISGDKEGGEKMLAEVARVSRASGNLLVAVVALCRLAMAKMQRGQLYEPKDLFEQALDLAVDDQGQTLPIACEAMTGLGKIHWGWNDLEIARKYLIEGTGLSQRWKQQVAIDGYVTLAHISQSLGDVYLADQMIEKAGEIAAKTLATEADDHYVALNKASLWVRRGDLGAAARWAMQRGSDEFLQKRELVSTQNVSADLIRRYELTVFARLLIAEHRLEEALQLLDLLLPFMEQNEILEKVIEIHILRSIAFQVEGKSERALSSLKTALRLARPEGHLRPFLDERPALVELLKKMAAQGIEDAHWLVEALLQSQPGSVLLSKTTEITEPLSDREMEVLHLLVTDLTVPEIAEELYISVSTVRSHVKNIYRKLGAHSRLEAVSKAKDANLL
ncbi:MAG: LuxR C-terminal-related transcriptional regulator [Anaerolineales bacterium]